MQPRKRQCKAMNCKPYAVCQEFLMRVESSCMAVPSSLLVLRKCLPFYWCNALFLPRRASPQMMEQSAVGVGTNLEHECPVLRSKAGRRFSSAIVRDPAVHAVLIQERLNPLTGVSEWEVVTDEADNADCWKSEAATSELARTSYLDMLNDSVRNAAYARAIQKVVRGANHVLDIGAGTGLLSMMALRSMKQQADGLEAPEAPYAVADDVKITACESFLPMLRLARKVLRANNMNSCVHLLHKRSDELQVGVDMPCRADVLVSEILDSELLGEGLIPTLRHAHANLLTSDVRSVPFGATVYGQLVECDFLWRCYDLPGVEAELADGLSLSMARGVDMRAWLPTKCEMHVDALSGKLQMLSDPFKVFDFEFSTMPSEYRHVELDVPVIRAGVTHALVSWWVLELDEEGSITYSAAPQWIDDMKSCWTPERELPSWREHWKQCVWFLHGENLDVTPGNILSVVGIHDSISMSYCVRQKHHMQEEHSRSGKVLHQTPPNLPRSGQLVMKPERVNMLGNKRLRSLVVAAAAKAVQGRSDTTCLVVDDSLLMTVAAACTSPSTKVVALLPGLKSLGKEFVQAICQANGFQADRVAVLSKKASSLTSDDLPSQKVDVLLAEPYYWNYEGMLPWQNLRFWFERTVVDHLLAENVSIMPFRAVLRGIAVYLPDLWQSRCRLEKVEGFDHTSVNRALGACATEDGPILPYALWQCGRLEELTESSDLLSFNFTKTMEAVSDVVKIPFSKLGSCHAIVVWLDWVYDINRELVYSTGPRGGDSSHWKQGVKLLTAPVPVRPPGGDVDGVDRAEFVTLNSAFDPSTGEVRVDAQFCSV